MADFNPKHFEFISINSGAQDVYIKCFQNTSLRKTAYIKVSLIDELIRFNLTDRKLNLYFWREEIEDGKKNQYWTKHENDERLNLKQLINDCEEVREYINIVAPQFTI